MPNASRKAGRLSREKNALRNILPGKTDKFLEAAKVMLGEGREFCSNGLVSRQS